MEIRPILSTLRRHKTAAALIVLEIALSCAIICNAVFLISTRIDRMNRPSGLIEDEVVRVQMTGVSLTENTRAVTREDLAALRAIPGVKAVASTNQVPYGNSSWNNSVFLQPGQQQETLGATVYFGSEEFLETLGLRIVAGRAFNPDEYIDFPEEHERDTTNMPPVMIVTRSMAERLFPGEDPIGKQIYTVGEDAPKTIVGVVENLIRPNDQGGPEQSQFSMLFPVRMPYMAGGYLLRTDPERRAEVLKAAVKALEGVSRNRILLRDETFESMRDQYYRQDRSMAWLLVAVCVALLVVTALGIVGLASFWVQQRTKQIGVRRALGATRAQILGYFQTENLLLSTLGIVIGMIGAYAINQLLMGRYELPRLPLMYLPIGVVALWALGQLSVLGPARRAAAVPPAVATRTV